MDNAATAARPVEVEVDAETRELAVEVVDTAAAIKIENDADYERAGELLRGRVKRVLKHVDETFAEPIRAAHAAHKSILAAKKRFTAPLLEAERLIKGAMGDYHAKRQREINRQEQERLAAARREAEQRKLDEAVELEDAGRDVEAEAVLEEPATPIVAAPAPAPPKAAGTSVRTITKYRVVDASKIDPAFLIPDDKKIGTLVRSVGSDAERLVGGIEVYEVPSISARG